MMGDRIRVESFLCASSYGRRNKTAGSMAARRAYAASAAALRLSRPFSDQGKWATGMTKKLACMLAKCLVGVEIGR